MLLPMMFASDREMIARIDSEGLTLRNARLKKSVLLYAFAWERVQATFGEKCWFGGYDVGYTSGVCGPNTEEVVYDFIARHPTSVFLYEANTAEEQFRITVDDFFTREFRYSSFFHHNK